MKCFNIDVHICRTCASLFFRGGVGVGGHPGFFKILILMYAFIVLVLF